MSTSRLTEHVISELLLERDRIVTDYGKIQRTGSLVGWTSLFPGGHGVYRGDDRFGGPLPRVFPNEPFMFVAHNYDGTRSYHNMLKRGWERRDTAFWKTLWAYLDYCGIDRSTAFLTNVYMGLRSGDAIGEMQGAGSQFKDQCIQFFYRQVEIVNPRLVVVMGDEARKALVGFEPKVYIPHPSACRDDFKRDDQVPKKVAKLVVAMAELETA